MADVLSEIRSSLEKRLRELEPLIKEHAQVREALDALKGTRARTRRAAVDAASGTATSGTPRGRRGRPRGTGRRAQEALKLVHDQPGIAIAELAEKMKIGASYLRRVLAGLEQHGKLRKDGKGYHPVEADRGGEPEA